MEYKTLEFKRHIYVPLEEIKKKHINDNNNTIKSVQLSSVELKSLLSYLFAYSFHSDATVDSNNKEKALSFFTDSNEFFNISKEFGRCLIENLEGFELNWFENLLESTHNIENVNNNEKLNDFIDDVLINQIPIRQWEYGRFFLQKLFLILTVSNKWKNNQMKIFEEVGKLDKKEDNTLLIARKIQKVNTSLDNYKAFTMVFVLKEKLFKEKMTLYDYTVISQIAQQKMIHFFLKRVDLFITYNKCLDMKWNNNKGRGGHKR